MNRLTLYIAILFLFSCTGSRYSNAKIIAISAKAELPLVIPDQEKVGLFVDSNEIYYFENLVMYRIPITHSQMKFGETIGDTTILVPASNEIRYRHFIYRENDSTGLFYNENESLPGDRIPLDSIVNHKSFKTSTFYNSTDTLLSSRCINNNIIIDTYLTRGKKDFTIPDTVILYFFKKKRNIDFGFNESLFPENRKDRIYKVNFIYSQSLVTTNGVAQKIPKRMASFESKFIPVLNEEEILKWFIRFKNEAVK